MSSWESPLGEVCVLPSERLPAFVFQRLLDLSEVHEEFSVGLNGGRTPILLYRYAVSYPQKLTALLKKSLFGVSDERCVPLDDPQSNFGLAKSLFFDKLSLPQSQTLPFQTHLPPERAASLFEQKWRERFKQGCFKACLLGMGVDGHIASLFPNCPLLEEESDRFFAATAWPGKGWRLTITLKGLAACQNIFLIVTGEEKARTLKHVLELGVYNSQLPVTYLGTLKDRLVCVVDEAAGKAL